MNRNYVFKVILISTAIALTVGITGRLGINFQKNNNEKTIEETILGNSNINSNPIVDDEANNLNYQDNEEKVTSQSIKAETLAVTENKKIAEDKKVIKNIRVEPLKANDEKKVEDVKEVEDTKKVDDTKEELKPIEKVENLISEDMPKEVATKSGFARDYYEKDGDLYIVFDEAEFYIGEEAKKEYLKDGNTEEPMDEWGNDYYIRNNDKNTKVYKVSKNSKLEILSYELGEDNSTKLVAVSADKIKENIDKYKGNNYLERGLLFNIDESDSVIYGMRRIYTP